MKELKVVIGKNFGDEGKGQAVSDLCKGQAALVVRHNGGAQAGHTVEEENFRFVFHQLGSGSLWGCPTYWSKTFLPDLLKLGEEAETFQKAVKAVKSADGAITIYAHPDCACTVVYDIFLNSITEQLRDADRHGSCGMGIYEAVLRGKEPAYRLCLRDFMKVSAKDALDTETAVEKIAAKLETIRREYTLPRLQQLREQYPTGWDRREILEWVDLVGDDNLLWNVAEEMCANFAKYVRLADLAELWGQYGRIVFENAQGLMLDEDNMEYYPHLTPSHTGLYNVERLLSGLYGDDAEGALSGMESDATAPFSCTDSLEVIYVTRTYVTRHGAGRLDLECPKGSINPQITDATNIPNPWQDQLRFARHLAGDLFFRQIMTDVEVLDRAKLTKKLHIALTLRLTHLDETDNKVLFEEKDMDVAEFEKLCAEKGIRLWQVSRGTGKS